jgi:hypothetical protein
MLTGVDATSTSIAMHVIPCLVSLLRRYPAGRGGCSRVRSGDQGRHHQVQCSPDAVVGFRAPCAAQVPVRAAAGGWGNVVAADAPPRSVLNDSSEAITVAVDGIAVAAIEAPVIASVELTLLRYSRSLTVSALLTAYQSANVVAVRTSLAFDLPATYALLDDGALQMMNQVHPLLATQSQLTRLYCLGRASSMTVTPVNVQAAQTVIVNGVWDGQRCGVQFVHAGSLAPLESWTDDWDASGVVAVSRGQSWGAIFSLTPNSRSFPASLVPADLTGVDVDDVHAILAAVYGSPAGALMSHQFAPEGRISPCVASPDRCYDDLYNFFDPDSFFSITAMGYAFDGYLFEEMRKLLETNERFICQRDQFGLCEIGQLPHHFVPSCDHSGRDGCVCVRNPQNPAIEDCLTYYAISSATQTGPNIFWLLAAVNYVTLSGNYTWLQAHIGSFRLALQYLMERFDASVGLVNAPGPLWIDTFIRNQYASDTNAAMVILFRQLAMVEAFVGNTTGAATLNGLADTIVTAMNKLLWDTDHYVTQVCDGV